MEQRDYMLDQIEQLGRVLAKILADFLGLKSKGNIALGIETSNKTLNNELNIETGKMISLDKNGLGDYLADKELRPQHLEILSDYLCEIGKSLAEQDKEEAKKYLEKAIEILDLADEISNAISFERISRKKNIGNILQKCI